MHAVAAPSPAAHLPPDVKRHTGRLLEQQQELYTSPTTGRNTKLGRKVEKPADPAAGGPSGQKDTGKHDRKHTNK